MGTPGKLSSETQEQNRAFNSLKTQEIYISQCKKSSKGGRKLAWLGTQGLASTDVEKAEIMSSLAWYSLVEFYISHVPETLGWGLGERNSSHCKIKVSIRPLCEAERHKSVGPEDIHPMVLKELADLVAKLLSIIFENSNLSGKVLVSSLSSLLYSREKERPRELQAGEPQICAWEDHGADSP